jgi:hypothetical protein
LRHEAGGVAEKQMYLRRSEPGVSPHHPQQDF